MTVVAPLPAEDAPLARLLAAYLDGRRSRHTADTYRRDNQEEA